MSMVRVWQDGPVASGVDFLILREQAATAGLG